MAYPLQRPPTPHPGESAWLLIINLTNIVELGRTAKIDITHVKNRGFGHTPLPQPLMVWV